MAKAYVPLLLLFCFSIASYSQQAPLDREVRIGIDAVPINAFETANPSRQRFGSLEFRGGLVLTSAHKLFGGISALRVQKDGEHFIALSDRTTWIQGRIVYRDNRPEGLADVVMAPVLDAEGKPAPGWDTESIAQDGGMLYVGLERLNTIVSFDHAKMGLLAPGLPVAVPPELKDLPFNQGLESLVYVPENFRLRRSLIGISENGRTASGDLKSFLIGGPTPGMFAVKRSEGYYPSDAALLPSGDILLLERQYSQEGGMRVQVRRLRLDDIKPGAVVDGPAILQADKRHELDNMEALSVHENQAGEIVLTIMSDNNHSDRQRTLLLQFVLRDKP